MLENIVSHEPVEQPHAIAGRALIEGRYGFFAQTMSAIGLSISLLYAMRLRELA